MQLAAQGETARSGSSANGVGAAGGPERQPRFELRRAANYWRSQHARAKERIEKLKAESKAHKAALREQGRELRELRERYLQLECDYAGLQQRNADLLKSPFGKRSEKLKPKGGNHEPPPKTEGPGEAGRKPAGEAGKEQEPRKRGGQRGGTANTRVDRSELTVREEIHEPEEGSCECPECGKPYSRNGEEISERIEIEVRGHTRRIRRPRYRASCQCAQRQGQPVPQAIAPLPPALFRGSSYGLSVWVTFVVQVYWQQRPVRAFEREWQDCGVRLPAGTLLGHVHHLLTWFEPLVTAIGVYQQQALVVHGDETSWVVHVRAERGENARCWLWVCWTQTAVRFLVDPSRSAAAAAKLFGGLGQARKMVLVCDRYSAYVKLAREHAGQFELAICWVHSRRDFVSLGRSRPDLQAWVERIVERIAKLYRLNRERLAVWDRERALEGQSEEFGRPQKQLQAGSDALFQFAGWERCSP